MAIQSEIRVSGPFAGGGGTVNLDFDFKVFDGDELYVVLRSEDGEDTPLEYVADYSVVLNEDQDADPGGRVTLVVTFAAGVSAYVASDVEYLQETVFTNTGGFYPRVLNDSLDRAHILILQLKELLYRTIRGPVGETMRELPPAAQRRLKILGFDDDGQPIMVDGVVTSGTGGGVVTVPLSVVNYGTYRVGSEVHNYGTRAASPVVIDFGDYV